MSRVAQWKRAGPITQRSEDQNLALLKIVFIFFVLICYGYYIVLSKLGLGNSHNILVRNAPNFLFFYFIFFPETTENDC